MTFRVGQKVVCVDAKNRRGFFWVFNDAPQEGTIYTVSDILIEDGTPSLVLLEHTRHPESKYKGFATRRFRPAVERKTSIEVFTRMLLPQGVDA